MLAEKVIRVNDPLSRRLHVPSERLRAGRTSSSGPRRTTRSCGRPRAARRRQPAGILWRAARARAAVRPRAPARSQPGRHRRTVILLDAVAGHEPGWHARRRARPRCPTCHGGTTVDIEGLDLTLELRRFSEYTLLIAKRPRGADHLVAFASLLAGWPSRSTCHGSESGRGWDGRPARPRGPIGPPGRLRSRVREPRRRPGRPRPEPGIRRAPVPLG